MLKTMAKESRQPDWVCKPIQERLQAWKEAANDSDAGDSDAGP